MRFQGAALSLDAIDVVKGVFDNPGAVRQERRRVLKHVSILVGLALIAILILSWALDWNFTDVWRYELVAVFGASVGTAELLSRYRDAPTYALLSAPGSLYVGINAVASVGALSLVLTFGWTFGATGDAALATQVLIAGFGAMGLFRSSLLTVKAGDNDVGIGPSTVLSIIMEAADRSTDRLLAADRAGRVTLIMQDVDYQAARDALPRVSKALMQNLAPADRTALDAALKAIDDEDLAPRAMSQLLGLKLVDYVSTAVLQAAKDSLGDTIKLGTAVVRTETPEEEPSEEADVHVLHSVSEGLPMTPQAPDAPAAGA